jgi:hypothetical protein
MVWCSAALLPRRWRRRVAWLLLEQDVFGLDDRAFDQDQRTLQQVVELAHVAGPCIGEQQVRHIGGQRRNAFAGPRAQL